MNNISQKTKDMILISLFAVIISICAWISIPAAVPFTMQTFAVFLSFGILGGKRGTMAVCVYILLGAVGIPVFAGGTGGIGIILGKTGGYMLGWIVCGIVISKIPLFKNQKNQIPIFSMFLGLIICYATGTAWFTLFYTKITGVSGIWSVICTCVLPFIIPDLIKISLAYFLQKKLKPHIDLN